LSLQPVRLGLEAAGAFLPHRRGLFSSTSALPFTFCTFTFCL
jgi:hypothetical protein